jgi:hypothetical protein
MDNAKTSLHKNDSQQAKIKNKMQRTNVLTIGLNYARSPYELGGCVNDAKGYAQRFKQRGAEIADRWGDTYTPDELLQDLQQLKERATSTTRTVICFSGHGTEFPDFTKESGMGQGICLWDGKQIHIVDDTDFSAAVRQIPGSVFVILDSCYSGGMDRMVAKPQQAGMKKRCIEFDADTMKLYQPAPEKRASFFPALPGNKTYWLFASKADEVSWDTGTNGLFSMHLFGTLDNSASREVGKVMERVAMKCSPDQTPNWIINGRGTSKRYIP